MLVVHFCSLVCAISGGSLSAGEAPQVTPFDFLVDGRFLRTSLAAWMAAHERTVLLLFLRWTVSNLVRVQLLALQDLNNFLSTSEKRLVGLKCIHLSLSSA